MTSYERSIKSAAANLRLEGMHVTEREKHIAMDCLTGKRTFNDAVSDIIRRHKKHS